LGHPVDQALIREGPTGRWKCRSGKWGSR